MPDFEAEPAELSYESVLSWQELSSQPIAPLPSTGVPDWPEPPTTRPTEALDGEHVASFGN